MAADIHLGSVYFEDASGDDAVPDRIEITFEGGAAGTQLTRLVIDGDKLADGKLTLGDIFFDTRPGGAGTFNSQPLRLVSHDGFEVTSTTVDDGSMQIIFEFSGFDAGEKLVFTIDVDEQGSFSSTALAEGGEFEGSKLTGTFTAPHYEDATAEGVYFDDYDGRFEEVAAAAGSTLKLPRDSYMPPATNDRSDMTAGAAARIRQTPRPITVSGRVFEDVDLDNQQDQPGDIGLAGVQVALLQWNGADYVSFKTTVTNAAGEYKFVDVEPGKYRIVETQPPGYVSVGATAGRVNGVVRGEVTSVDVISHIELLGGEDSVENNFAEAVPAAVSGHVFHDRNNNGQRDAGEEGIGGVTLNVIPVQVVGSGAATITVATDASGFWQATGLNPGTYRVVEVQPAGYLDGLDRAGTAGGTAVNPGDEINGLRLLSGAHGQNYDFGELVPSRISGVVHADLDGDCEYDPGEPLLEGVTIELRDGTGVLIRTVTTDSQGRYQFDGLRPGTYEVREIQPAGYFDGSERVGTAGGTIKADDWIGSITLVSGTIAERYDFCEILPSSISGRVIADLDGDCEHDPGETLLAGVTIELLDENRQVIATTVTDEQGGYRFDNLPPGVYAVREVQPAGYLDGAEHVGTAGGVRLENDLLGGIRLISGTQAAEYDFCEIPPASLSGRVHADLDGDCVFDPGEQALAGVHIELRDAQGNQIATTTTNAEGRYRFDNLVPGTYTIVEHQPDGYFDGAEHAGTAGGIVSANDTISQIVLGAGVQAIDYNFCELLPSSITGRVHVDTDGDGQYDAGEPPLPAVVIELVDAQGSVVRTTKTDAAGVYRFDGLAPGSYGLREQQPAGYFDGYERVGTAGGTISANDQVSGIVLVSATAGEHYDFGELLPNSLAGRVHADLDGDCFFDPGEQPLAGVVIELLDATGNVIRTTQTGADGRYRFENLAPGVYGLREIQPAGYLDGGEKAGSAGGQVTGDDLISGIKLVSGIAGENYDFCEVPPSSLAGRVHADLDGDCFFDPGEQPLAGVVIELLDATGSVIRTTQTDTRGEYRFDNLSPGSYGIREIQPAGYFDGADHAGTAGGTVAGNDLITQIQLGAGIDATDYNFCEEPPASLAGRVHADLDGDCVLDAGEQPLAGVVIELLDAAGNVIRTTQTDARGEYRFDNLAPGSYGIREIQPAGYFDGPDHVGTAGGVLAGNDLVTQILLGPAVDAIDYNFCEVPAGKIAGYAFQDGPAVLVLPGAEVDLQAGRDGRRTPDDAPIAGVVLWLADEHGNPILDSAGRPRQVVTDANGYYEFANLSPGTYTVFEEHPSGYEDSLDTPGSTGGVAANPGSEDLPPVIRLVTPHRHDAIIGITLDAGVISVENNFSELRTELLIIPPPPAVPPRIVAAESPMFPVVPRFPLRDQVLVRPDPPTRYGGSSNIVGYTWHLSVIDAGQPRSSAAARTAAVGGARNKAFRLVSTGGWEGTRPESSDWKTSTAGDQRQMFGMAGAVPVVGDFNGDGLSELGVFFKGEWYIDLNGNGVWDEGDLWARLGHDGDRPVTGDWNGDGKTDIGIFGPAWPRDPVAVSAEPGLPGPANPPKATPKNMPPEPEHAAAGERELRLTAHGKIRRDLIDHVFFYGTPLDIPVVGDWNGDGIDSIAVFRDGDWYLDVDGDGRWGEGDRRFHFGEAGDVPVVGDWDGNGVDEPGVFRDGVWHLDTNRNGQIDPQDQVVHLGGAGTIPVVGDFNGDGVDEPGVYTDGGQPTP